MYAYTYMSRPDMVAESVERRLQVQKVGRSKPSQVKPMTYKIDSCRYLV